MKTQLFLNTLVGLLLFATPAIAQPDISPTKITPGIYEICAAADKNFVLDMKTCTVEGNETITENEDGSLPVQMFRTLDVNQQKFYIEQLPGNAYRISALNSGDALTADDTDIVLSHLQRSDRSYADDTQIWYLENTPEGYYYIVSEKLIGKNSDALIDDITESTNIEEAEQVTGYLTWQDQKLYNGTGLCLDNYTDSLNQKWILRKTWISETDTAHTDFINPFSEYGPYSDVCLMLKFGKEKEVLTSEDLASWVMEEDHTSTLSTEALLTYAQTLADKYDTQGHARKFMTSYGKEITLYKGNFGWKLDVEATAEAIKEAANYHRQRYVKPIWTHEGVGFTRGNDIGDSYVEIDLVNQKVWLYQNGEQLLATECVSGTYGTDRQTPGGVYAIYYKQSPAVLRGADYESPVTYWMPFNGGIGLHDANWRSDFGGDIFRYNGSHGCINLPTSAAKLIYQTTSVGYPVVCYN